MQDNNNKTSAKPSAEQAAYRVSEKKSSLQSLEDTHFFDYTWVRLLFIIICGILMWSVVSAVSKTVGDQLKFSVVLFIAALIAGRFAGHLTAMFLIFLSVATSLRYMFWRLSETVVFHTFADAVFGWGLVAAELYALVILLLGFFQTSRPLKRHPIPINLPLNEYPTVDVFIPTYNEPIEVVKQTIIAAQLIDWPTDKFKVYVLDDGYRVEFKELCEAVGAGYIARDNNLHAKAGNINNALKMTKGELIAIFDSDHIPTRSFLQVCVGWFLKDPKLAMLQTPHVFFSPDPFEKNLNTFRRIPNEGELFYGLIQDGNDLWNATFFCGSCAIIRRKPLEELGGIATESVTEDALTALRLNRRGYNTAYLAVPQAAGLATENISRHIGQRIRWARGMAQIFRIDNPLLGPGLTLAQRLCYLNAMMHFFFGLPRLVFLTAPLAFLLFDVHLFHASAAMIAAYALPHIAHSNIANSFVQGKFRHSFWNEVYESVLAWYIARPVLVAIFSPKSGSFNVTAKGSVLGQAYFDWSMAMPYLVLVILNITGFALGVMHLMQGSNESDLHLTIIMNLIWTTYNIIILGASVAVANETKQFRENPRVPAVIPDILVLPDGRQIACETIDFSPKGLGMKLPSSMSFEQFLPVQVILRRGAEEAILPAKIVFSLGDRLGLKFESLSIKQEMDLAAMTFSRADAWTTSFGNSPEDSPLKSLYNVIKVGIGGVGILFLNLFSWTRRKDNAE